ncbi:hypothetical protein [Wukongibacter sp. M2B1]|uniref:hypothetical protein n=1 Tax=Wukongibacter sp. M2B1 TaxID=3088895 RepID=UPI003D7B323A
MMNTLLKKLQNLGTILTTNGLEIDSKRIMITVKATCSVGVVIRILNNPDIPGLDLPFLER